MSSHRYAILADELGGVGTGGGQAGRSDGFAFGFFCREFEVQGQEEGEDVFLLFQAVGGADGGVEGGVEGGVSVADLFCPIRYLDCQFED